MINKIETLKELWKNYEKTAKETDRSDPHKEEWEKWKVKIKNSEDGKNNDCEKITVDNYQLSKPIMPKKQKLKKDVSKEVKQRYDDGYKEAQKRNEKFIEQYKNSFGYFLISGSSKYFGAGQNKVLGVLKTTQIKDVFDKDKEAQETYFEKEEHYSRHAKGFVYENCESEKALEELKFDIEAIRAIIDKTGVKGLIDIEAEKNHRLSTYPRHKLMVLTSLADNADSDLKFKLPLKAEIDNKMFYDFCELARNNGDDYKQILEKIVKSSSGDSGDTISFDEAIKNAKNNWVIKGVFVISFLYKCFGIETPSYDVTSRMSDLLWNLDKAKEFEDIDKYWQIVYTGAPGTGKTYGIRNYVKINCFENPLDDSVIENILKTTKSDNKQEISTKSDNKQEISNWKKKQQKFVQFHSAYDYSDFVEGIRPVQISATDKTPTFVRMDGVFKKFCRDVVTYNKAYEEVNEKSISVALKEGEAPHFYFIIDEINRADVGKVFGELMFGLEESYRGKEHPVDTQYMNMKTHIMEDGILTELKDEDDDFSEGFYIPENVHIIGSMNNIDRSVETFDFALRRRFQWVDIKANNMLKPVLSSVLRSKPDAMDNLEDFIKKIENMNKVIDQGTGAECGLDENYHIGPAYFKEYDGSEESLTVIWNEKILPILYEYVRGRRKDVIDTFISDCEKCLIGNSNISIEDETEAVVK